MARINFDAEIRSVLTGEPMFNGPHQYELLLNANGETIYINGEPAVKIDGETGKPVIKKEAPHLTLKDVCFAALNAGSTDDGKDMAKMQLTYLLMRRVAGGGSADMTAEEITLLKERVYRAYAGNVQIVGRAWDLLDPPSEKGAEPPVPRKVKTK